MIIFDFLIDNFDSICDGTYTEIGVAEEIINEDVVSEDVETNTEIEEPFTFGPSDIEDTNEMNVPDIEEPNMDYADMDVPDVSEPKTDTYDSGSSYDSDSSFDSDSGGSDF